MTNVRTQRNIPPLPPFKGGNAVRSAISKQRVVCRVGANLVFALFLCYAEESERKFRKWAQMGAVHRVPGMTIDN